MTDLDHQLKDLLSAADDAALTPPEPNYYREVWDSLHGQNATLLITTWIGILVFGGGLIYCVVQMFLTDDLVPLIRYAALAVMLNSAQIALKLWYNMRLNRSAMLTEIRKVRLLAAISPDA